MKRTPLFAAALVGAALGSTLTRPALAELDGEVAVAGSSTVGPITAAIAEEFQKVHPKVSIPIDESGTSNGFKRFVVGETAINNASRVIKAKEIEALQSNGIEFIELPVAYDGITFVVNKENTWAKEMTVDQIKQVFLAGSKVRTWKDIDPSYPDVPVAIYMPGTGSGTFDYFKEEVAGKDGSIREDVTVSEDDNVLVRGVVGDAGGIGFFGCAYYFENQDKLQALKIKNPESGEFVAPSAQTIESGEYAPFSRPLFIYVNQEKLGRAEVKAFVDFYLDAVPSVAEQVGYVRLPRQFYRADRERLDKPVLGSAYYDDAMNEKKGSLMELYGIKR